jgi:hypothetical protein
LADFFSNRFGKNVWITNHARQSMEKRAINDATLLQVIETGDIRQSDETNLWLFCHIEGRTDNLICAAIVKKEAIVVKTVMINWELEDEV